MQAFKMLCVGTDSVMYTCCQKLMIGLLTDASNTSSLAHALMIREQD